MYDNTREDCRGDCKNGGCRRRDNSNVCMTNFIKDQQQIVEEAPYMACGCYDPDCSYRTYSKEERKTLIKQIITNTVNHLMAGVEDRENIQWGRDTSWDIENQNGFNQANAKIRQLGADIISEVSE